MKTAPTPPRHRIGPPPHTWASPLEPRLKALERRVGVLWTLLCIGLIIGAIHLAGFLLETYARAAR